MKKWTKTALLTGCACCIAGAVLMFSGWASGGKAYAETYDLNAMSGSAKKEDGISTQEKSSFAPNGNAYSGWLRSVRISVGVPASGPGVKWRAS